MRYAGSITAVLVAVMTLAASAPAAPTLNGTFDLSAAPSKITQGSDGNIWVVVGGAKLARITPDGTVTETDLDTTSAKGITSGPDGNLWKIGRAHV